MTAGTGRYGLDDLTAPGFNAAHNMEPSTKLERAQEARIMELERRLGEMERLYDKAAADLIEALDVASAYRATASTLHQEVERRDGAERRQTEGGDPTIGRRVASYAYPDRRKSWPC